MIVCAIEKRMFCKRVVWTNSKRFRDTECMNWFIVHKILLWNSVVCICYVSNDCHYLSVALYQIWQTDKIQICTCTCTCACTSQQVQISHLNIVHVALFCSNKMRLQIPKEQMFLLNWNIMMALPWPCTFVLNKNKFYRIISVVFACTYNNLYSTH